MFTKIDLGLHLQELEKLVHAQYLSPALKVIAGKLSKVLKSAIRKLPANDDNLSKLSVQLTKFIKYFQGSTMNEIPYEIEFCLRDAISDWFPTQFKCIIATAQVGDKEFFIDIGTWREISTIIRDISPKTQLNEELILVGVPKMYNHIPIFYTAMYHELGHFVDREYGISMQTVKSKTSRNMNFEEIEKLFFHEGEYFADIFAASYVGATIKQTLQLTSPNADSSVSHPATNDRVKKIENFLGGKSFSELIAFRNIISSVCPRGKLQQNFILPDIESSFNDLRPFDIEKSEELHGILVAGWSYLENIGSIHKPEWRKGKSDLQMAQIVNDLIEKSIRNYSIVQEWKKHSKNKQSRKRLVQGNIIRERMCEVDRKKKLWIHPLLEDGQEGELTLDLRLGYDFLVSIVTRRPYISINTLDNDHRPISTYFLSTRRKIGEKFVLYPNQIVLTTTLEYVGLPDDCFANVYTRSSFSKLGISFDVFVEPSYRGCVSIEMFNHGNTPIELIVGARMFQMKLTELKINAKYGGNKRKYAGLVRPTPSRVSDDEDLKLLKSFAENSEI